MYREKYKKFKCDSKQEDYFSSRRGVGMGRLGVDATIGALAVGGGGCCGLDATPLQACWDGEAVYLAPLLATGPHRPGGRLAENPTR